MPLRVIQSFSAARNGTAYNEDRIGHARNRAWVLDAAAPPVVDPSVFGTELYVEKLNMMFKRHVQGGFPYGTPQTYFKRKIREMRLNLRHHSALDIDKIPLPSLPSTAMMMTVYNKRYNTVTFYGLGDCIGMLRTSRGRWFQTTPTSDINEEKARVVLPPAEKLAAGIARKMKMNQPGGYPIISIHENAAHDIKIEEFQLDEGETAEFLIVTDGLWRLVDTFDRFTPDELFDFVKEHGIEKAVEEVRYLENRFLHPAQFECSKIHDDASASYGEIVPA